MLLHDRHLHLLASEDVVPVTQMPVAITLRNVNVCYGRERRALVGLSLVVPTGATCAVLGPNGAGKSTLLELLAGLRVPTTGTVTVLGATVDSRNRATYRSVALVTARTPLPSGYRVGALLRYVAPWHPGWNRVVADALLAHFGLARQQRVDTLSVGGRMKVQLLCALAACPRVLLLDEPFTGLDLATRDALLGGLLLPDDADGRTVLIASHDLAELEILTDHLILLDGGRVRLEGALDDVRSSAPRATSLRDLYRSHTHHAPPFEEPAA